MKHPKSLHPANADELATIALETGAEVLRGPLRYPSESGGWQLGHLDLSEHLDKYRDQELMVTIASLVKAEAKQALCGICGFVLSEVGECPRCKLITEEAGKEAKERQEVQEALFREIEDILEQARY